MAQTVFNTLHAFVDLRTAISPLALKRQLDLIRLAAMPAALRVQASA